MGFQMQVSFALSGVYTTLLSKLSGSGAATSSSASDADATSASATTTATTTSGSSTGSVDFTHMTSQQLLDWTSSQLKSGQMTGEDSMAFVAMAATVDVAAGQTVVDDTKVQNFMQVAQQALAGAQSRHDDTEAAAFANALAIMQSAQGASTGIDITV